MRGPPADGQNLWYILLAPVNGILSGSWQCSAFRLRVRAGEMEGTCQQTF